MSGLPEHVDDPRGRPARRPADRGSDSVVRQARTAGRDRRHRGARGRGHGVRLPVEGAGAGRRPRTRRRAEPTTPTSSSRRWWPVPTAPSGRSPRACARWSTWCRPPTGTAAPTSGRSSAEATAQIAEIVAIAHDAGVSVEVIIATAWDCPFDGPTPPQRVLDDRRRRSRSRCRPAGDRRHHRHHHARTGHLAGEPGAPAHRRPAAGRALPQHPRRGTGQRVRRGDRRA